KLVVPTATKVVPTALRSSDRRSTHDHSGGGGHESLFGGGGQGSLFGGGGQDGAPAARRLRPGGAERQPGHPHQKRHGDHRDEHDPDEVEPHSPAHHLADGHVSGPVGDRIGRGGHREHERAGRGERHGHGQQHRVEPQPQGHAAGHGQERRRRGG